MTLGLETAPAAVVVDCKSEAGGGKFESCSGGGSGGNLGVAIAEGGSGIAGRAS